MAGKKDFVFKDSEESKSLTRDNHYVPQWYQKGFIEKGQKLHYLNLAPDEVKLENGKSYKHNEKKMLTPAQCFFEYDLYTTFFGPFISDIIERKLFGEIDFIGAKAVKAFIDGSLSDRHDLFKDFFRYIDAQKIRTPKGLTWLKAKYQNLDQMSLMAELEAIQQMNCTMWLEGTREIVSAKNSPTKFIISDHPVTIYNYACPPDAPECSYPGDPAVALKASMTVFPLDQNHCLILSNLEFAEDPQIKDPKSKRTNARNFGGTMVNTMTFPQGRELSEQQVREINFILKKRARRYIAAAQPEWLYPERDENISWENIKNTLLLPKENLFKFGGEMFAGFKNGKMHYQDAFGRTSKGTSYLNKRLPTSKIKANSNCPCGQGRKYKNCCRDIPQSKKPSWDVYSIRERNMVLYNQINEILGLNKGKDWDDIRRELSDEQVREIHLAYGSLWPAETQILNLLPKSDGRLRVIYSGVIDIRSITRFVTMTTLYFDEVIIQHPFINANQLKSEYSPVESPSKFKQQTLLTLALFFALEPYIFSGKINLVPDPGIFNEHLRFGAIDAAKKRRSAIHDIQEEDMEELSYMLQDDWERTIYCLSNEQKHAHLKEKFPDLDVEMGEKIIAQLEDNRKNDPLALLQDDLYQNGGQVSINSLSPNFEMSLFLAQITGAIILTSSQTKFKEFSAAQYPFGKLSYTKWDRLIDGIGKLNFPFNQEAEAGPILWRENHFGEMRKAWRSIYKILFVNAGIDVSSATDNLLLELSKATEAASQDMSDSYKINPNLELETYGFDVCMECIIPEQGIANRQVQRFLLTSGLEEYSKNVPMAILLKTKKVKSI